MFDDSLWSDLDLLQEVGRALEEGGREGAVLEKDEVSPAQANGKGDLLSFRWILLSKASNSLL